MKTGFFIVAVAICFSCTKNKTETRVINETLKANTTYRYNLGGFPIEQGARIVKQPLHFLVSKIERDSTFTYRYIYVPALDYVGKDEAVIEFTESVSRTPKVIGKLNFRFTIVK